MAPCVGIHKNHLQDYWLYKDHDDKDEYDYDNISLISLKKKLLHYNYI